MPSSGATHLLAVDIEDFLPSNVPRSNPSRRDLESQTDQFCATWILGVDQVSKLSSPSAILWVVFIRHL